MDPCALLAIAPRNGVSDSKAGKTY